MEKRSALIVIDLQVGPLWGTYKTEDVVEISKQLVSSAKTNKVPIYFIQHEGPKGDLMERGTPYWEFVPGILQNSEGVIIPKRTANSFFETDLEEKLKKEKITHLFICGAKTEYCIDTTCRVAMSLGFDVTLIEDAHTTSDGILPANQIIAHHNHTFKNFYDPVRKVRVLPSKEVKF